MMTSFKKLGFIDSMVLMPAKNLLRSAIESAGKYPELLAPLAVGGYWTVTSGNHEGVEGHDHQRYCVEGFKWKALALATAAAMAPKIIRKYTQQDFYRRLYIDLPVNFAIPDSEENAKEKEAYVRERLYETHGAKVDRLAPLTGFYDVLDALIKDPLLLPKIGMPDYIPDHVGPAHIHPFKGKTVDITALLISLLATTDIHGGIKWTMDPERVGVKAAITGIEAIASPFPSLSADLAYEMYRMAEEVYAAKYGKPNQ